MDRQQQQQRQEDEDDVVQQQLVMTTPQDVHVIQDMLESSVRMHYNDDDTDIVWDIGSITSPA